jgi:hypothetical protein
MALGAFIAPEIHDELSFMEVQAVREVELLAGLADEF